MSSKALLAMIGLYIVLGTGIVWYGFADGHRLLPIINGTIWFIGIGLLIVSYQMAKRRERRQLEQLEMIDNSIRVIQDDLTQMNGWMDEDPWKNSPFSADVIKPGDPGWEIFEAAMKEDGVVVGQYDASTGEVISIENAEGKDLRMRRKEDDEQ